MLYYKVGRSKIERFALAFDGSTQYLQSQKTADDPLVTEFSQWEFNLPTTTFIRLKLDTVIGNRVIFDSRAIVGGVGRGILIWMINDVFSFEYRDGGKQRKFQTFGLTAGVDYILQATYTGIGNNYTLRINDVIAGVIPTVLSNGPATILGSNRFTIGESNLLQNIFFNGEIREFSVVNYVKSVPEMQSDFTAGTQSVGSGAWRVAPIRPIYKTQIKTLDTAQINTVLPNSNAFLNSQNNKINLFGYPNPLVKGINLIQI